MTHGIDTGLLVAVEIHDHPFHHQADGLLRGLIADGHDPAVAPQTLAEFIHVVTDAKRIPKPLTMVEAISRAEHGWHAVEVRRVFPEGQAAGSFLGWLSRHRLGRKRLLDTLLAATYQHAGIKRLLSNNDGDFRVFGGFEIVSFR